MAGDPRGWLWGLDVMMDALRGFCALEGDKEEGMAGEPGVYRKRDGTGWAVSQAPRPMISELSQAPSLAALQCWSTTVP